jgi:hypothetical protein
MPFPDQRGRRGETARALRRIAIPPRHGVTLVCSLPLAGRSTIP